jgi:hypothetical protein
MDSSEALLQDVVYYGFSKLSEAAQNMFLDSVSVLQGQPLFLAKVYWEAQWRGDAHRALRHLKQLSFISTTQMENFSWTPPSIMHEYIEPLDVIRSLGQSILLKPDRFKRLDDKHLGSRVWVGSGGDVQGLVEVSVQARYQASLRTPGEQCLCP